MGYGCRNDLARHLGRSGDGGVDGAVPQDVLGLDVIYIQAKRYRPGSSVPVSAVREFAGSLDAARPDKGVFVTTATFPRSAAAFVSAVPSKIVLIDGQALADLLIRYNIGVKVRETYEVKQIDDGYMAAVLHRAMSGCGKETIDGRRWGSRARLRKADRALLLADAQRLEDHHHARGMRAAL
jgi:restriction endonuclease Mrr